MTGADKETKQTAPANNVAAPLALQDTVLTTPSNKIRKRSTQDFSDQDRTTSSSHTKQNRSGARQQASGNAPAEPTQAEPETQAVPETQAEPEMQAEQEPPSKKLRIKKSKSKSKVPLTTEAPLPDEPAATIAKQEPVAPAVTTSEPKSTARATAKAKSKAKSKAPASNSEQPVSGKSANTPTTPVQTEQVSQRQKTVVKTKAGAMTPQKKARQDSMAQSVGAALGRANTSEQLKQPEDTPKPGKKEKTPEQKASHARFMRFSRSLQSTSALQSWFARF